MADKMDRAAEAAEKEASQVKFFKCLTELLKEHRDILHFLPEMFERFTEMEWNMPTEVDTHNFDTSRYTVRRYGSVVNIFASISQCQ